MSNYAFFRSNASLIIIGSVLGLAGGFKIANLQYYREQSLAKNREIAQAADKMPGSQAEVAAIIEKAKSHPEDADAQVEAAFQFIQIERFQQALEFLEQARKVDPNDRRASAGLGLSYFMLGQFDPAIESLKRARELGVDNPSVTSLLIGAYVKTGKNLDEAERLYKELESKKVDPETLAQIRADLNDARTGKTASQGGAPDGKNGEPMKPNSTLNHGPEPPKIAK
jgi:tetratricopeptide (TPR) repeat protein